MPDQLPSGSMAVYVFLEMVALAFVFGAVEAFVSDRPWYVWVGCLVLGILFFLAGIKWGTWIGFVVVALLTVTILAYGAYRYYHKPTAVGPPFAPPVSTPLPAIYYSCTQTSLPIIVPAGDTAHVLALNRKQNTSFGWGFYEVDNHDRPLKALSWPNPKLLLKGPPPSSLGYMCEITNHGPGNTTGLAIPLSIWYGAVTNGKPPPFIYKGRH